MELIEVERPASPAAMLWPSLRPSGKGNAVVEALPQVGYVRPQVTLDPQAIAAYAAVCGFAPEHGVPLTYPHLLTFPLVMAFLASPACPWPAMGTIHLANRIRQHARIDAGDALRVELATGSLFVHEKGQVFTLESRILRGDSLVWESTQTLLRKGVAASGPPYESGIGTTLPLSLQAELPAAGDTGRRYSRVSGDYNPIHLSALSARLFGFRRALAHGMWTKARALATLLPRQPLEQALAEVEFKSPLFLPSRATLWTTRQLSQQHFEVRNGAGNRTHLRGLLDTAPNLTRSPA